MAVDITSIVNSILADPKPVIMFDTCALLDIIRCGSRDNISPEVITSAIELVNSSDKWLLACNVVEVEWNNNVSLVEEELVKQVNRTHKSALVFKGALDKTESLEKWVYQKSIVDYGLETELKKISKSLLDKIDIITEDPNCLSKASSRLINNLPPASKGKSEFKDCLIFEHCLEVGVKLKFAGFKNTVIFVSSNKSDFGKPFDSTSSLYSEFQNSKILYVGDIRTAANLSK